MTNLKRIREATGVTQKQLSESAGLKLRSLQELEQGRHDINKAAAITVLRISKILGCQIEDLLEQ